MDTNASCGSHISGTIHYAPIQYRNFGDVYLYSVALAKETKRHQQSPSKQSLSWSGYSSDFVDPRRGGSEMWSDSAPIRVVVKRFLFSKTGVAFHCVFLLSVALFTLFLITYSLTLGSETEQQPLWYIVADAALDIIITIEVLFLIWWKGRRSFFQSYAGQIDFTICLFCLVTLILERVDHLAVPESDLSKAARIARDIVRFLRSIVFWHMFFVEALVIFPSTIESSVPHESLPDTILSSSIASPLLLQQSELNTGLRASGEPRITSWNGST